MTSPINPARATSSVPFLHEINDVTQGEPCGLNGIDDDGEMEADFLPPCGLLLSREVLDLEQQVHESRETAAGVGVVGALCEQQVPAWGEQSKQNSK